MVDELTNYFSNVGKNQHKSKINNKSCYSKPTNKYEII